MDQNEIVCCGASQTADLTAVASACSDYGPLGLHGLRSQPLWFDMPARQPNRVAAACLS